MEERETMKIMRMTLIPVGERSLQLQKSMSDKIHRVNQRK
jgi:hypothetical protein